jgi:hypothetical protein
MPGFIYTGTDFARSEIGCRLSVADHVRLLAYRVVTTGRWQDFDLLGSVDVVRA